MKPSNQLFSRICREPMSSVRALSCPTGGQYNTNILLSFLSSVACGDVFEEVLRGTAARCEDGGKKFTIIETMIFGGLLLGLDFEYPLDLFQGPCKI